MPTIAISIVTVLVRYGAIPEVARFAASEDELPNRGAEVVVRTRRGLELGTVLESVRPPQEPGHEAPDPAGEVVRIATPEDFKLRESTLTSSRAEFSTWQRRIRDWGLDLQLIDLEQTLDASRLILYVLNERGPECTKLALQAAAAGLGVIEVQPVSMQGPVTLSGTTGGGCGSGGCGCH